MGYGRPPVGSWSIRTQASRYGLQHLDSLLGNNAEKRELPQRSPRGHDQTSCFSRRHARCTLTCTVRRECGTLHRCDASSSHVASDSALDSDISSTQCAKFVLATIDYSAFSSRIRELDHLDMMIECDDSSSSSTWSERRLFIVRNDGC